MLGEISVFPAVPVSDVARSRRFYEEVLGLTPLRAQDEEVVYRAGDTRLAIYRSAGAGGATHTLCTFSGAPLDEVMEGMRERGVVFEEYDFPGLKTVDGVAQLGADRVAWFKDPDGNILSIDDASFDE